MTPLLVASDKLVQAFDVATGQPLWQTELPRVAGYTRIASAGDMVVVAVSKKAFILDSGTGAILMEVELWFGVQAAIAEGESIVLTGTEGLACFMKRGYAWGIRSRRLPGGFLENNGEFWVENARGEPIARLDQWVPWTCSRSDLGLALGRSVFQPDINT